MAYLKVKDYEAALEDCQTLAENYKMDADLYFLTGETALAMDSYEEASANFEQPTAKMQLMTELSRSTEHI